jgi:protein-arginine kinase activator protein McsA
MLVEKVYTGDKRYKYVCDKCGKPINTKSERRYKIGIDTPKDNTSGMKIVKRYDLCKRCTSIIINYIEKKGK